MKKNLFIFELLSTIFIIFLGFILHFLYEWSGENILIGTFSSVNESTWEHLKLLFFPLLITISIGYFYFKDYPSYLCVKTKGLLLGMIFIVIFFYTYSGILGYNIPILDIGSFIIAVIISEYYTYKKINLSHCNKVVDLIILTVLSLSFFIFTFNPPMIDLFKDPVTDTYGINKKERFPFLN